MEKRTGAGNVDQVATQIDKRGEPTGKTGSTVVQGCDAAIRGTSPITRRLTMVYQRAGEEEGGKNLH